MTKVLLISLMVSCAPAMAREESLWSRFLEQTSSIAEQAVDLNEGLIASTKTLFEDYLKIFEVPDQAANKKEIVKQLAHEFAGAFEQWSLDVARNSQGSVKYKQGVQKWFCSNMLRTLSAFAPTHSQDVEREFEADF